MSARERIKGLYVITAACAGGRAELARRAASVIGGGARVLQYRDKSGDAQARRADARLLASMCRGEGVCFIVNDDVDLAEQVEADGVHLGRDDLVLAEARRRLGPERLIGVSCYDSLSRAAAAAAAGADYLAFGSFYPSASKPEAVAAQPWLLAAAKRQWSLPLVAIGGITAANAPPLVEAGADALAVISSVFLAEDPLQAARRFSPLFPGPAPTIATMPASNRGGSS